MSLRMAGHDIGRVESKVGLMKVVKTARHLSVCAPCRK